MLEIISQPVTEETSNTLKRVINSLDKPYFDLAEMLALPLESLTGVQLSTVLSRLLFLTEHISNSETGKEKSIRLGNLISNSEYAIYRVKPSLISNFIEFALTDGKSPSQDIIHANLNEDNISGGEVALLTIYVLIKIISANTGESPEELVSKVSAKDWRLTN